MKALKLFSFLTIIAFFAFGTVSAQHLPFQGKLLENGQPVNGIRTFVFSINQGVIFWSETHPSVPVNNGLYAVVLGSIAALPSNLFAAQTALNLNISVNGTPLDVVPIYPPIEADPTVPAAIKDGINWNEIGNIPPKIYADTSATNELQQLSIQGNFLTISNGNTVEIPTLSDSTILQGDLVVGSTLQVGIQDTLQTSICQMQTSSEYSVESAVWQSFVPEKSGSLTSVQLEFGDIFNTNIKLTIYPGQGNTGQPIWSKTYNTSLFPAEIGLRTFPVDLYAVPLTSGLELTFEVKGVSNNIFVTKVPNNPFTGGICSFGATYDLKFCVHSEYFTETGLFVDENGNVGIGTNNPQNKLDVFGNTRINGNVEVEGDFTINGTIFPPQGFTNIQVFTSSGNWIKPVNISKVYVKVIGGGGKGGDTGGSSRPGGGGGGGGYAEGFISVSGNVAITIGSTNSFNGNTIISATKGADGSLYHGGIGGSGSGGQINVSGTHGQNVSETINGTGGMGGASGMGMGAGGSGGALVGGTTYYGAENGGAFGGGGGGATNVYNGAFGDPGAVIVYW